MKVFPNCESYFFFFSLLDVFVIKILDFCWCKKYSNHLKFKANSLKANCLRTQNAIDLVIYV